jgi:glycosyltransferase involved in cell wall biosynthesis
MDPRRVAIVIPALNEAATIAGVVERASASGTPIVVDDGSRDGTSAIAAASGADVVRREACGGYDAAMNAGFARASELGCDVVITMDADGQHDAALLQRFIEEIDRGADVVVGIRDRRARVAEHAFAWLSRLMWGIRDPLCGMKAYRIGVYRELGHFDSYTSIGTELALFAAARGYRITQIPVPIGTRHDQPRFGRRFSANRRIFRALWMGASR